MDRIIIAAQDETSVWGESVPNWIVAVAALIALGAAIWAAVSNHGLRVNDDAREQARRDAEDRAQAERIATWWEGDDDPQRIVANGGGIVKPGSYLLRNASHLPVENVGVLIDVGGETAASDHIAVLPPGDTRRPFPPNAALEWGAAKVIGQTDPAIRILVEFNDSAGRRWKRDTHGELFRVPERDDHRC